MVPDSMGATLSLTQSSLSISRVQLVRIGVHRALVCIIYLPMSTDPDSEN